MASERLQVILELSTSGYRKEAREAATATGQIGDSAKTSSGQLDLLGRNTENVGRKLKGFATGALLAVGAGLAVAIGELDQLGQKMEATERMADVVFGDMADDARAWSDANNEAFGIGETAMLGLIAKTQDLLVPMGFVREEAFGMSQEILTVANSLSEWSSGTIDAEDAQLRLTKALLGETEGLVELGVKISQADIQARLTKKGMDGLTGSALQQAKAQVTLELVTERSTDALKAYEDRAGTAIAAQKELEATTADTAETWADIFRPIIDGAKESLGDLATVAEFTSEKTRDLRGDSEDLQRTLGDTGFLNFVLPGFEDLRLLLGLVADAMEDTGGEASETAAALRFMADATKDDLTPAVDGAVTPVNRLSTAQRLAGDATRHHHAQLVGLATFLAGMINPVLAAHTALTRLSEAHEAVGTAAEEHGQASEEFALAQIELALATAEAEVAFGEFGTNAEASIDAVAQALGIEDDAARTLLETLGLLDGMTVTTTIINRQINLLEQGVIPEGMGISGGQGLPVGAFDRGGVVPGPMGSPQMILAHGGETILPTHRAGVSGGGGVSYYGPTINVNSPTNDLQQDLQYATILASVTNLVEGL
ncbi:MAG TPA: hypothetical protein VM848_04235 [Acidimicrobiia bacterium]|nr:hypothetical protein [Acidimicrobiia bacterium]